MKLTLDEARKVLAGIEVGIADMEKDPAAPLSYYYHLRADWKDLVETLERERDNIQDI